MNELPSFFPSVEDSYQRLLSHIPGMVYRCRVDRVLESDGRLHFEYELEFVSDGSLELLGIGSSAMVGRGQNVIERMTHPDDLEKQRSVVYEAVVSHQPYQVMYRMKLPGNVTKWVWDQGEGVYGPDGELWFLEGLMMDVSEQKFKELSLREENRQLRTSASSLFGLGEAADVDRFLPADGESMSLEAATLRLEEKLILKALEACRWHRGDAAQMLGLNLRTLHRKMRRLGIGSRRHPAPGQD